MRRITAIASMVLLSSALGGCGTMANMRGEAVISLGWPSPAPTVPFGGVRQDAQALLGVPYGFCLISDLPFSLVGDIVTLPWTTCVYARRQPQPTAADDKKGTQLE